MAPQITHLTFDFFGTLVQYKSGHFSGEKKYKKSFAFLEQNNYIYDYEHFVEDYTEVFNALTKQSLKNFQEFHMDEVTYIFFKKNNLSIPKQKRYVFTETYLDEWNDNIVYFPEIQTLINRLKTKYSLNIISNTHYSPLVINNLKSMHIEDAFERVITSVEHGSLKPHPRIFMDTLKALKASPEQTVHIGDSYADDFTGAQNAGIRCILIDPDGKYRGKIKDRVTSLFDIEQLL